MRAGVPDGSGGGDEDGDGDEEAELSSVESEYTFDSPAWPSSPEDGRDRRYLRRRLQSLRRFSDSRSSRMCAYFWILRARLMRMFPAIATIMPINDFQRLRFSSSESSESRCKTTENSEDDWRLELERSMVVGWWCGGGCGVGYRGGCCSLM